MEPADAGRLLDRLHTLAVHDGPARVGIPSDTLTLGAMKRHIEQVPGAVEAEASAMGEPPLPGREAGGEIAPGAASAQHVEDGVEDAPQWCIGGLPRVEAGRR